MEKNESHNGCWRVEFLTQSFVKLIAFEKAQLIIKCDVLEYCSEKKVYSFYRFPKRGRGLDLDKFAQFNDAVNITDISVDDIPLMVAGVLVEFD